MQSHLCPVETKFRIPRTFDPVFSNHIIVLLSVTPASIVSFPPIVGKSSSLVPFTSIAAFHITLDSFIRKSQSLVCERPYLLYLQLLWCVQSMALPRTPRYLPNTLWPHGVTTAVPHHTFEDFTSSSSKPVFEGFPVNFPAEKSMFHVQPSPEVTSLQIRRIQRLETRENSC